MSERSPNNTELELSLPRQIEMLETPNMTIKMVTESPVDGIAYRDSYSNPCLIINLAAKSMTIDVKGDGAEGYKGTVIPGDFSFLPANSVQEGYYRGEMVRYACLTFSQERFDARYAERMVITKNDPLVRQFARSLFAHRHRHDPDVILYRDSMSEALIQHLQLVHLSKVTSQFNHQPNLDRLERYIRANLNQKLTVGELAKLEQTTPKLLQKAVREKHHQTVYEWITTLRLERSLQLIRDNTYDLATIAMETGFADQSHWTRLFRRQFGITPGKLRQSY